MHCVEVRPFSCILCRVCSLMSRTAPRRSCSRNSSKDDLSCPHRYVERAREVQCRDADIPNPSQYSRNRLSILLLGPSARERPRSTDDAPRPQNEQGLRCRRVSRVRFAFNLWAAAAEPSTPRDTTGLCGLVAIWPAPASTCSCSTPLSCTAASGLLSQMSTATVVSSGRSFLAKEDGAAARVNT